jgi:hypothetical protein
MSLNHREALSQRRTAMKTIASSLIALSLFAGAAIAAEQREAAETDQLCNYCQDYTDAAMAAGPVRTTYQVGVGYSDETKVANLADARRAGQPSDDRK